jgi:hypothetical protein
VRRFNGLHHKAPKGMNSNYFSVAYEERIRKERKIAITGFPILSLIQIAYSFQERFHDKNHCHNIDNGNEITVN